MSGSWSVEPPTSLNRLADAAAVADLAAYTCDLDLDLLAIDNWSYEPLEAEEYNRYVRRDRWVQESGTLRNAIADANELPTRDLGKLEITDLVNFLESLTDPGSGALSHLVPDRVPSGLPVDR